MLTILSHVIGYSKKISGAYDKPGKATGMSGSEGCILNVVVAGEQLAIHNGTLKNYRAS